MSILLLPKKSESFNISVYHRTEQALADKMWTKGRAHFNKWQLDDLTDYIVSTTHSYVRENAIVIYDLAQVVANKHGEKHPELYKLTELAFLFFHDLLNHLKKEEQILFPKIKQLLVESNCNERNHLITVGSLNATILTMKKEHLATGKDLKLFYKLTRGYHLPPDACNSYKYLFRKMKEFENDIVSLINLENNILFPKAIALDEELKREERIVASW